MKVGYSPVLKIDPEFKSLMHPLSEKEFLSLRENILDGGTTYSIAAWNEYLIDGYERYMICRQENIPYHVHRIGFSCREHAITWICREQLKKGNFVIQKEHVPRRAAISPLQNGLLTPQQGNSAMLTMHSLLVKKW